MSNNLGKERLEIVEIDLDYCSNTYASAPCAARLGRTGTLKCFNGWATCQDKDNYSAGTLTLRFADNQSGLPKGQTIFPALKGVNRNASNVNLGGVDDTRGPLGKRARITVTFDDFPYHDTYTDKYAAERASGAAQSDSSSYNPRDRGTFFSKLRTRFPFYQGRALRLKTGLVGDALADMRTEHYVIDEWAGPDANGRVTVTAKDVLDLADNDKALAPAPSRGKLGAQIAEIDSLPTIRLTPETIGDEYPSSGYALIGSEIVGYTRSGDEVTLTSRGAWGSEASTHDVDDTFQDCLYWESVEIRQPIRDLLRDYAKIDPDFIPYQDWGDETGRWLAGYNVTTLIPKPTGVAKLVGEIVELGLHLWWDQEAQEIKLRGHRPLDVYAEETAASLNDDSAFVERTLDVRDLNDQRLTQVHIYHGVLDYSKSVTDSENFRRLVASVDLEAEADNEYGETRVYEIFTRWLGDGNDSLANSISGRRLARYRDMPRELTFGLDIKDKSNVSLAGLVKVTTRLIQDVTGAPAETQMQVYEVQESAPNHRLTVKAETFTFDQKIGFIMPPTAPNYGGASDTEKQTGCYIVSANNLEFGDGEPPHLIW